MSRCLRCGRHVRLTRARRPRLRWVNHALACAERGTNPAAPARRESAVAWEMRTAWARRRQVVVTLEPPRPSVHGYVQHVAASGAYAVVWDGAAPVHVPSRLVAAVRLPHFHETVPEVAAPSTDPRPAPPPPGQLALEVGEGDRPPDWTDPRERLVRRRAEGKRRSLADQV